MTHSDADSDADLIALLRRLDDPQLLEYPRGYDHAATRALFERLVARLDADFTTRCRAGRHLQAPRRRRPAGPAAHVR